MSTFLHGALHVFQSESTLYSCLNVKEFFAHNRRDIWSLSDSNGIQTHNHLVSKQKLNHLAKLVKWLSCVVSAYLYGAGKSLQSINWVASAATRSY